MGRSMGAWGRTGDGLCMYMAEVRVLGEGLEMVCMCMYDCIIMRITL